MDDDKEFRKAFNLLLKRNTDIEVIAEANNGNEFLELLKTCMPDIVFMDINMPILDGIVTTKKKIGLFYKEIKVIALADYAHFNCLRLVIEAGASGYVSKGNIHKTVNKVIYTIMTNALYNEDAFLDDIIDNEN